MPAPEFKAGQTQISARDLNWMSRAIVNILKGLMPLGMSDPGNGTFTANPVIPSLGGSKIVLVKVTSVQGDYLVCRTWDGATLGSADIIVAKPYTLRVTPFDGQTIGGVTYANIFVDGSQRSATTAAGTELHRVFAAYAVGDSILAARVGPQADIVVADIAAEWIDLNVDARQFMYVSTTS